MRRIHPTIALTISALLITGCANDDPQHFSNSIYQVVDNWTADAVAFGKLMRVERNPARLRADLDRLAAQIKELVASARTLSVPPVKGAQELSSAFQTYLADQEKMVTQDFEELISILGSPDPDMDRFRAVLGRCQQIENADLARLHQAEAVYAIATGTAPQVKVRLL